MRAALALALVAALAARAGANPCRDQPRLRVQAEVGSAWSAFTDGTTGIRLEDHGYDVGHVSTGARAAIAVRPLSCLEVGVVARRAWMNEGQARDGAVLRSRGDVAAALFGFRYRMRDRFELAMLFEVGVADTVQTLRGARVDGHAIGFAGRDELVIGRGATALVLALDITAYLFGPEAQTELPPRLWGLGLYAGLAHRF